MRTLELCYSLTIGPEDNIVSFSWSHDKYDKAVGRGVISSAGIHADHSGRRFEFKRSWNSIVQGQSTVFWSAQLPRIDCFFRVLSTESCYSCGRILGTAMSKPAIECNSIV